MAGWDISTLKEHLEAILKEMDRRYEERFGASERAVSAAFAAAEKASTKSEVSATERLDTHNALQAKMDKQAASFAEKEWVLTGRDALEREVRALADRVSRFENREEGMKLSTKILVGFVAFMGTCIGIYFALNR